MTGTGTGPARQPASPHRPIDLGAVLPPGSRVTVEPGEHDADRAARIRQEERAAFIKDCREVAVFAVVLLFVVAIASVCGYVVFASSTAGPDQVKFAQTILTALISGGTGFLFGKAIGK